MQMHIITILLIGKLSLAQNVLGDGDSSTFLHSTKHWRLQLSGELLQVTGLWKKVLKEKYLHSMTVVKWLRSNLSLSPRLLKYGRVF
jgi:hypothetical protein